MLKNHPKRQIVPPSISIHMASKMNSFVLCGAETTGVRNIGGSSVVVHQNRNGGALELVASIETRDLKDEEEASDISLELPDKFGSSLCGTASSNNVVDNQDLLARLDSVFLHLEEIRAILLEILGRNTRTGELALFAHSGKADAQPQGQAGAKEKPAGIESDNDIGAAAGEGLLDLKLESVDKGVVGGGVGEEGHDIDKLNARDGKVAERPENLAKLYLCTGELGGGGGGGGGLSSRGILLLVLLLR